MVEDEGIATYSLPKMTLSGGFEQDMSRAEAARILGVRESACKEQVMDHYR